LKDKCSAGQVLLPNLGGWFFLYLLAGFLFLRPLLLLWDGAVCRHFLNGLYALRHHAIATSSYTIFTHPEVASESRCWLGDIIMGLSYQSFHLNGVVLVTSVCICLSLIWSYQIARARGLGCMVGLLGLVLVTAASSVHWSARCHVFSYLPLLIVYYFCFVSKAKAVYRTLGCMLSMALAVNLHGAFTISLFVLLSRLLGDLISLFTGRAYEAAADNAVEQPVSLRANAVASLKWSATTFLLSVAATLLNPRGLGLYLHIAQYLGNPVVGRLTDEWRPLDMSIGLGAWAFVALLFACSAIFISARRFPNPGDLILFFILFAGGCRSMRLIPYFALIAMPACAPAWQAFKTMASERHSRFWNSFIAFEARAESGEVLPKHCSLIVTGLAALMSLVFLLSPGLALTDFDPERMPVKTVEAVSKLNLPAAGFDYDNWGGYLYYKLNRPVFVDDWLDFLPVSFLKEYLTVLTASSGWQAILDNYKIVWALIPKQCPLAAAMLQTHCWQVVSEDTVSVLLVKRPAALPAQPANRADKTN
jgi:hypothetical protein